MLKSHWMKGILILGIVAAFATNAQARRTSSSVTPQAAKMRVKLAHPALAFELNKVESELKTTYSVLRRAQRDGCKKCGFMAAKIRRAIRAVESNWVAIDKARIEGRRGSKGAAWWKRHLVDFRKALGTPRTLIPHVGLAKAKKLQRQLDSIERRYSSLAPRLDRALAPRRARRIIAQSR